jgi:hypothetical protein
MCEASRGIGTANKESVITYLPVVSSNRTSDGRQRLGAVEALHVFVANLRDGCCAALVRNPSMGTAGGPSVVSGAGSRVYLRRRLAAWPLRLPQCCGYADGCSRLVDALMAGKRQLLCCAWGGGGDFRGRVHRSVGGRVLRLHRFAVCMVLVRCVVLRDRSRCGESCGHDSGA